MSDKKSDLPMYVRIRSYIQDCWYRTHVGEVFEVRGKRKAFYNLDNHFSDEERPWWTRIEDCETWDQEAEAFYNKVQQKCEHGLFKMTCRSCYDTD